MKKSSKVSESKNSTITSSGVVADYFPGSTLDRFVYKYKRGP